MTKLILIFIACFLFTGILSAQNHMDIMTTMTGEHNFAEMGWVMTTLDWNGDGYDDLIVNEKQWKPNGSNHNTSGKLLIYFGGPNFDNVPEMEIPGHHEIEFSHTDSMCNAGDMNGDGIDELALFRATMYENNFDQFYDLQLCVYNGGANPDTIPDYVITFPREEFDNGYGIVRGLGDINHDGYDDLGYIICGVNHYQPNFFHILYGGNHGDFVDSVFQEAGSQSGFSIITGLGDVNGDGIDDFGLGYLSDYDNWFQRIMLYYGSESGVYGDSVVIGDANISRSQIYPVGDINQDGYADFVSYFCNNNYRLYYGNPDFNPSSYTLISPTYNGDVAGEGFGHGDVNGDGVPDIMGTNVSQGNGYGDAFLWMGGVPMNGTPDLHIIPPSLPWPAMIDFEMFGFCLTMGDYNGDGCCDAAISAPFDYAAFPEPGHVFVYAGNAGLHETPNADNTNTPAISKLQLYPNPLLTLNSSLNVRFTFEPSTLLSKGGVSTFEIFNIRGQKVKSFNMTPEQSKSGSANYVLNDLSSGVYLCVLSNGALQQKRKITIIK